MKLAILALALLPSFAFASNQAIICTGAAGHNANLQLEYGGDDKVTASVEMADEDNTYSADLKKKKVNRADNTITYSEARGPMSVTIPAEWSDRGFDRKKIDIKRTKFVYSVNGGVEMTLALTHCQSDSD